MGVAIEGHAHKTASVKDAAQLHPPAKRRYPVRGEPRAKVASRGGERSSSRALQHTQVLRSRGWDCASEVNAEGGDLTCERDFRKLKRVRGAQARVQIQGLQGGVLCQITAFDKHAVVGGAKQISQGGTVGA